MFNMLLSKAHSAFGAPKAVVRARTTMLLSAAGLDSGMGSFIMII